MRARRLVEHVIQELLKFSFGKSAGSKVAIWPVAIIGRHRLANWFRLIPDLGGPPLP